MAKHGKAYRKSLELLEPDKKYSVKEAVGLVKKMSTTKFDSTIEIHIFTGADVKHADQIVRATITLPAGTGKKVRIAAFCEEDKADSAKKSGADIVGGDDLIEKIGKGEIDFDTAVSTPTMMKSLAKIARILGPKGLMPSPKAVTVSDDIAKAISELKKGKIEFRTDKSGIIHTVVGKASFSEANLIENTTALLKAVYDNKPNAIKANYIKSITLVSTMGPGIQIAGEGAQE